jgi:Na+-driven multidrug efflux pump
LYAAVIGGVVIRVALAWPLGAEGFGVRGVWIASLADWVARTLLLAVIFFRGRWTRARV